MLTEKKTAPIKVRQKGFAGGFWDLFKHGITYSALSLFLRCPEQFRLQYVEGWSTYNVPEHLEFGNCIHWILEQCYKTRKFPKAYTTLKKLMDEYDAHWSSLVVSPTADQLIQQQKVYGMAMGALPAYFIRWDGDVNGGNYTHGHKGVFAPVKWLGLEDVFEVPYTYPDGAVVMLRGKIDGVYQTEKGKLQILDTKTKGQIRESSISDKLKADFQFMIYSYVATRKYGPISGAAMNIFRRPQIKQGDLTVAEYYERIKRDCAAIDRFDHYFMRMQVQLYKNDLANWVQTRLDPAMDDIRGWFEGRYPHVPRDEQLDTYGPCPMMRAILDDDFTGLYKRPVVFPELPGVAA